MGILGLYLTESSVSIQTEADEVLVAVGVSFAVARSGNVTFSKKVYQWGGGGWRVYYNFSS